jgi:hypothetical protein
MDARIHYPSLLDYRLGILAGRSATAFSDKACVGVGHIGA